MKELLEYRIKMIARLDEAAHEFCTTCKAIDNPWAKIENGWTLHQIAAHTRHVQKEVYGKRIHRTLSEDNPEFKNFEAEQWMKTDYNPQESLEEILGEFAQNINTVCETLRSLPQEAWSRESCHESQGGELTLQRWVEHSLAHIEEHLDAIKK